MEIHLCQRLKHLFSLFLHHPNVPIFFRTSWEEYFDLCAPKTYEYPSFVLEGIQKRKQMKVRKTSKPLKFQHLIWQAKIMFYNKVNKKNTEQLIRHECNLVNPLCWAVNLHCNYDSATKKNSIDTRLKFHKNNLRSQWRRKFARQIELAQNSRNCLNKQRVNFPSWIKHWQDAQAQNTNNYLT